MTDTTRPDGVTFPSVPNEVMQYIHAYGDSRADDDGMSALRIGETVLALRRWAAALTAPASKPAGITDKVIADAIPVTATMLTTGPRNKVCMTRSELHQFAAALSHAKPAAGGVVDEQKAFEKEFGSADQQRLDSDGVARHAWARKGWMARAALAREGGES